jgi:hypothetical protein
MVAVTSIHVIEGKPTASAQLIGGLVRRAGHKLRVTFDRKTMTATAQIIRADDPAHTWLRQQSGPAPTIAETALLLGLREGPHEQHGATIQSPSGVTTKIAMASVASVQPVRPSGMVHSASTIAPIVVHAIAFGRVSSPISM